ncbi:MAG: hypothetical protein ACREM1_09100 [Longimicrobiales bacterium]
MLAYKDRSDAEAERAFRELIAQAQPRRRDPMDGRQRKIRGMDEHEALIRSLRDAIMKAIEIGEGELVEDLNEMLGEARRAYREYLKTGSSERAEQLRRRLELEIEADERLSELHDRKDL